MNPFIHGPITHVKKKKFYAVKIGNEPGIYTTWEECESQVKGYSGAKFKSFFSEEEAISYLNEEMVNPIPIVPDIPYAYVDGSISVKNGLYGCGGYLDHNGNIYILEECGDDPELMKMKNISGEILGAVLAVETAEQLGIDELLIYHDFLGISEWALGNWKTSNIYTEDYNRFMNSDERKVKLYFQHVKGHTGVQGNDIADIIAKHSVGARLSRRQQEIYDDISSRACEFN